MEKIMKNPCHGNSSTQIIDRFQLFPEDLVISIFKKLPTDLKFLTQCSLVSHLFSATIHRLPAVKLTIPPLGQGCLINRENGKEVMLAKFKSRLAKARYPLMKFVDLRFVHLILPKDKDDRKFYHIKVKAEAEFYTVAYLDVMCNWDRNSHFAIPFVGWGTWNMLKFNNVGILWQSILVMLIRDCPMLQCVKISSSPKEMCINGEELEKLKNLVGTGENKSKRGFIRSLLLPVTGRMLEDVFVHIHRAGQPGKLPENEDDILGCDYGEERDDKVFGEAIKSIIMNHKNELR